MKDLSDNPGTYKGQNKAKLWGGRTHDDCDSGWSYAG